MTVEKLIVDHIDTWTTALQTRSTAGRGSSGKIDLYGIKKLRELILELAVRGKLVPQDPNDEPASVLLRGMKKQQEDLIKEKKIKKPKKLPPIDEILESISLPQGWELCYLNDIGDWGAGATPNRTNSGYYGGNIPWFKSGELSEDYITDSEEHITALALKECSLRDNQPGDVLIAMYGATIGKTSILNTRSTSNQAVCACTPFDGLSNQYLLTFLKASKRVFTSMGAGGAQPNISKEKIVATQFALPPLKEQLRIVEKVEQLMSLCDLLEQHSLTSLDAHQQLVETLLTTLTDSQNADELAENWARISEHFDTLFTTEASIDALKQTILQLAVMGKLVPQDPNDEPASELLKRIAQEKAQLVKDGKIKKQKPLPPISDEEKPFELPEGWEWCRVSEVAMFTTSGSRDWAKYYSESGALFVTMGNLSKDSYDLRMDNRRYVNPPENGEGLRTKLEPFDLIISITGDVGNLGLIPEDLGLAYINQHSCLLRFIPICRNYYFPELMRSPLAKLQFNAPQRGIKNSFRLSDVETMVIPLPPYKEQTLIAEKIKVLMNICDVLRTSIQSALTDAAIN